MLSWPQSVFKYFASACDREQEKKVVITGSPQLGKFSASVRKLRIASVSVVFDFAFLELPFAR